MRSSLTTILVFLLFAAGCEKKPPTPGSQPDQPGQAGPAKDKDSAKADKTAQILLDSAISARGGLEKLKATTSFSVKTRGNYLGMPYTAINYFQSGQMRMDLINAKEKPTMSMLFGLDQCWSTMGPVVMPCDESSRKAYRAMMAMEQAAQLWPLLEKDLDWEFTAGKAKLDIKEYNTLKVQSKKLEIEGMLYFDPQTHLLTQLRYDTSVMGKTAEMVNQYWEIKEACGIKVPHKMFITFDGQPYMEEETFEVNCQAPDEMLFEQPQQITDGAMEEKDTESMLTICWTHKGPYRTMGESFGKLMEGMKNLQLMPMGPPVVTYLKAPPKVKIPKKYLSEICFPISRKPEENSDLPKELTFTEHKPQHVLALYQLGDASKKMMKSTKKLLLEAKKRKLRPAGPLSQISYMDPALVPVEQWVFETRLPVTPMGKRKSK